MLSSYPIFTPLHLTSFLLSTLLKTTATSQTSNSLRETCDSYCKILSHEILRLFIYLVSIIVNKDNDMAVG